MARLQRIRRQERFLREKASEMVLRGVESLDDLESQERLELESAMINQSPGFLTDLGLPVPDDYFLASSDGGAMAAVVAGGPSGS